MLCLGGSATVTDLTGKSGANVQLSLTDNDCAGRRNEHHRGMLPHSYRCIYLRHCRWHACDSTLRLVRENFPKSMQDRLFPLFLLQ